MRWRTGGCAHQPVLVAWLPCCGVAALDESAARAAGQLLRPSGFQLLTPQCLPSLCSIRHRRLGVPLGQTLFGKTVLIVGFGNIAKELAVRCALQPQPGTSP